jgi:hypothetical protein
MATTTNYGWSTPDDTALVSQGAAAIRTLGSSADTTVKALSPGTTAGDVDYYTSSTAKARLGIGTTGQVLSVSGGVPAWATISSGGMTLISTTTMSGASITLSSIPATYNDLRVIIQNYLPATDAMSLSIRFNGDSGANRYRGNLQYSDAGADAVSFDATSFNSMIRSGDNGTSQCLADFTVPNYANTTTWKMIYGVSVTTNATTTTQFNHTTFRSVYNQTPAISSVTLFPGAGNFTSGTVLLYGVK